MNLFKKAIVSCALSLILIAPARASLGFSNPVTVVFGVAIIGSAATGVYGGYRLIKQEQGAVGTAVIVSSLFSGFWGFVILDGEQEGKFSELSPDAAKSIGVSEQERLIYNSEIDQVNAIAREIGLELESLNSDSPEVARDLWLDLGSELSQETMKTVISIASQE